MSGDCAIARQLVRESTDTTLLGQQGSVNLSLVDQWLDYYTACISGNCELSGISSLINTVLAQKTYLVGEKLSLADICIFILLVRNKFISGVCGVNDVCVFPHTSRWFALTSFQLECVGTFPVLTAEKKYPPKGAGKVGGKIMKNENKGEAKESSADGKNSSEHSLKIIFLFYHYNIT